MSLQLSASNICIPNKNSVEIPILPELTTTLNGASSYSLGDHDPRVLLFTKSVRGLSCADPTNSNSPDKFLEYLLGESWKVSPIDTLRLVFHIRDCRGGKGERKIFEASCIWLLKNHPNELAHVLKHIPFYGSWKDLPRIFGETSFERFAIQIHTNQLRIDKAKIGTCQENTIDTGAAKFAPSEKCLYDRKWNAVSKYACALGVNKAAYRKHYLRPLRSARTPIVEEKMCANEWETIDFSSVPSIAMKNYESAFVKHNPERYSEFLKNVMAGKCKINVSVLDPVEIVGKYDLKTKKNIENLLVEAQWSQLVSDRMLKRSEFPEPINILPIIDTSGSMFTHVTHSNIKVAVSLGLLLSLLNDSTSPFFRKWVNFSTTPKMQTFKGEKLYEIVNNLNKKNWSMTTNFQGVFDLILETAEAFSVPEESMPKMLVVISDMQFDYACHDNKTTNWEEIERKYSEKGYIRPIIVFWNLAANTRDMPIPHSKVPNCTLVSGFNSNILDNLIDGIISSPMCLVRKVIDSPRYERITIYNDEGSSSS